MAKTPIHPTAACSPEAIARLQRETGQLAVIEGTRAFLVNPHRCAAPRPAASLAPTSPDAA